MNTKEKQKLKKFIRELKGYRGRHTELVSVYIPADYDLIKIIQHLQQEQDTASNIKDARTRANVIDSLERMIRYLRLFKKTPTNGLAVFAGNASESDNKIDIRVWGIEPPIPLKTRLYRCDQTFVTDLLEDMIEAQEFYGLIVMDRREATIGILKGTLVQVLNHMTSGVPGKQKAGGQCHVFGTLVQTSTGNIVKIEKLHNPINVKSISYSNYSIKESMVVDKWTVKKNEIYRIKTKHPQLIVECSKDHFFFVAINSALIEKPAEELKKGDILVMPEKIEVPGNLQEIKSKKYYNSFTLNKLGRRLLKNRRIEKKLFQRELAKKIGADQARIYRFEYGIINVKRGLLRKVCDVLNLDFEWFLDECCVHHKYSNIKLPNMIDRQLAQFLGYYIGDGCSEKDRITFFEQRKDVALYYKNQFDKYFNIVSSYKFRVSKNYHQLRFTSRPLVRLIKEEFSELKKTLDSEVPKKILESPNDVVAGFLRGYFDSEGYINPRNGKGSIGIGSNNKTIIGQVHLLLLRFGIISSYIEQDNKKNPYSNKTIYKLKTLIAKKSNRSHVRQIIVPGKLIRKLIEDCGYNLSLFPKVSNFFNDGRRMSKQIFRNSILNHVKNQKLYKKLEKIYNYNILPVEIADIEVINKPTKMVDITVKNRNFFANGILVHNSAQRFARIREGLAKEFYKRISEVANKEFLGKKEIKGIIVGGPGPTKEEFMEYLNNEIKKKIIAVKDVTYTDEFGLNNLVELSQDILAKEAIAEERKLLVEFFTKLAQSQEKIAYGYENVKKALEYGAVEKLILVDKLDDKIIDEFDNLATESNTELFIVSTDTQEGKQLRDLGGIGAILRFAIQ